MKPYGWIYRQRLVWSSQYPGHEYGTEVFSNCNNKAVNLACSDYPFTFKTLGKEEERIEEQVKKSTFAEEIEESPKGKHCKIIASGGERIIILPAKWGMNVHIMRYWS